MDELLRSGEGTLDSQGTFCYTAPRMLAVISWLGTIAIFLVGGGILVHAIPPLHHLVEGLSGLWLCWPKASRGCSELWR